MFSIRSKGAKATSIKKTSGLFQDEDDGNTKIAVKEFESISAHPSKRSLDLQKKSIDFETKKLIEKAIEEDPSIFDYDASYDDLKRAEREVQSEKNINNPTNSQYMELMRSQAIKRKMEDFKVQQRKAEQEILQENPGLKQQDILRIETEAFKQYKKEIAEIEQKELAKEQEIQSKAQNENEFIQFHKDILDSKAGYQEAILKRSSEIKKNRDLGIELASMVELEVKTTPSNDPIKTSQLSGGLNILRNPRKHILINNTVNNLNRTESKKIQRPNANTAKDFEEQILRLQEEKQKDNSQELEKIKLKWAKKTTDSEVSEARRKALERKLQREQEMKQKLKELENSN